MNTFASFGKATVIGTRSVCFFLNLNEHIFDVCRCIKKSKNLHNYGLSLSRGKTDNPPLIIFKIRLFFIKKIFIQKSDPDFSVETN